MSEQYRMPIGDVKEGMSLVADGRQPGFERGGLYPVMKGDGGGLYLRNNAGKTFGVFQMSNDTELLGFCAYPIGAH